MMHEWCDDKNIESVTAVSIEHLVCSSSEALNLVFEDLARSIDYEVGLRRFEIKDFSDKNTLEEWPLNQLLFKSHRLQQLTIWDLEDTTAANRSQILDFAGLAATISSYLRTLEIGYTGSSAEDGDKFIQVLSDHHINWLESVEIFGEWNWFENEREECMAPLLVLLARQTSLKTIKMNPEVLRDNNLPAILRDSWRKAFLFYA